MGTPELFTNQYAPLAISVGQRLGVDPSLLLGQWGIETGWGKSVIPGTNNLGNIMDFSGGGVPAKDNLLQRWDNYRVFKTPEEFGDHYVDLIQRRYPGVSGSGTDSTKFATALKQGGYAEDPNYVNAVVNTVNTLRNRPQAMETLAKASPNVNTMSVDRVVGAYNKAKAANDAEAMAEIQGVLTTRFNNARQKAQAAGDTAAAAEIDARLQSLIGGNAAAIPVAPPVPVQGSPLPPPPAPVEETPAVAPGVESAPPSAEAAPVAAPVAPPVAAPTAPALAPPPPAPAPAAPALSTADILAGRTAPVAPAAPAGPVVPKREVTDAAFNSDPKWISNAKQVYKDVQLSEFGGSDAEAADWLKNYVAQTKWNMAGGATTIMDAMIKMSPEGKKALLESIKDYGDAPTSLESVGRAIKGIGTDPTTYLTLGLGNLVTKTVGKKLAQEGVKQVLESGISNRLVSGATAKAAASGAGYGAANDLIDQGVQIAADGQESIDPTKLATSTAIGAGAGAGINKILEKVTGRGAVRTFGKTSGSEVNAAMDAEIIRDLSDIANNSAKVNGTAPRQLQAIDANELSRKYINQAEEAISKLDPAQRDPLISALRNGKALNAEERAAVMNTPGGPEVLSIVDKSDRVRTLTGQMGSQGGLLGTLARQAVNLSPAYGSALAGVPIPITLDMLKAITNKMGGKTTRAEAIADTLKIPNRKAADTVNGILGDSAATKGLKTLDDMLLGEQMGKGREAVQTANEAAQTAAEKSRAKIEAAAAKAEEKRMVSEGSKILKERASANNVGGGPRVPAAQKDPNQLISELQGADPTYLLSLSNSYGAPRNATEMGEFSKTIRLQMEARAAKERLAAEAAAAARAAKNPSPVADRNSILEATGMPLGGPFQELLQGGRSGLNLTSDQAIEALRIAAAKNRDNPVGVAANQIRKSSEDGVTNPNAFYGLQNEIRKYQERGILGNQPGALSDASPIRNPISYAANVRTAESALKLAQDSAPNNGLAQFANVVARTKSPEAKAALVQKRLMQTSDPAEVQYLTDFIEPLTRFGAKTK